VRSDVIEALKGQGYSAGAAKKMAEGVRADDSFESAFRRVIQRNPAELIIFGNPGQIYSRQNLLNTHRAGNPIPAALLTAFESAAGSKLFDAVTKKRRGNAKQPNKAGNPVKKQRPIYEVVPAGDRGVLLKRQGKKGKPIGFFANHAAAVKEIRRLHPRAGNPDQLLQAKELFEKFHHRDATDVFQLHKSTKARKDFASLGPLVALGIDSVKFDKINPRPDDVVEQWDKLPHLVFLNSQGVEKVKQILSDPGQYVDQVALLASSPNGKQLYVIQPEPLEIDIRRFDSDSSKDFVDLGECTFVVYIAKKPHQAVEWVHTFAEEGGERPRLAFDRLTRQILFIGGSYRVEPAGIVN
jgi:hypothetical protein